MYKKIKNSSFMNWLWFLVYIMPLLLACGYVFVFQNFFTSDLIEYFSIEDGTLFLNIIVKFLGGSDAQDGFLFLTFRKILEYFLNTDLEYGNQIFAKIIPLLLQYFCIITLIHLAVDFLMLLPNICHKFMEKVGGERD